MDNGKCDLQQQRKRHQCDCEHIRKRIAVPVSVILCIVDSIL